MRWSRRGRIAARDFLFGLQLGDRSRPHGRPWHGDSLKNLADENMSLSRREALRDERAVDTKTKHAAGVARRFKLDSNLPDHGSR